MPANDSITTQLVERARALVPAVRERAAHAETQRRISPETIREFTEAGFFRIFQPKKYGGYELDYGPVQLDLAAEIGQACGSSAWVLTVLACHSWILGMFPAQAQDDVWGDAPNALLSSGVVPDKAGGSVVSGGLSIAGRWRFSSGVDHVQWALLGVPVANDKGPPDMFWCLIPRSDFTIDDTWRVSGLRGTGSNDIVVAKAFVPDHRCVPFKALIAGAGPGGMAPASHIYRFPLFSVFPFNICAPALGIARGAVDYYLERARGRVALPFGPKNFGADALHLRMVEAAAQIDSAEALLRRDAQEINDAGRSGKSLTAEQGARVSRDLSYAATLFMKAVDSIFYTSGGHGLFEDNPIQRAFRDVHAVNAQIGLRWELSAANYAQVVLGTGAKPGP
jgi:3-hydroxy-9,10-secoandrosta-1,3,5(10)-triene-9,17-dione monooxygenase